VIFVDPSKSRLIQASIYWSLQDHESLLISTGLRWPSLIQQVPSNPSKSKSLYWFLQDYGNLRRSQQVSTDPSKSLLISTGLHVPIDLYRTTPSPYWSEQDYNSLLVSSGLQWSSLIPARLRVSIDLYKTTVTFIDPSKSRLIPVSLYWSLQDYKSLLISTGLQWPS